jgi:4-alpha-glucanotransferase
MKQSGILLHISSLQTDYGIGDIGPAAYRFADYLSAQGHTYWQILPLNYPGYGDSPYNPISAFAFNEYLISPELLVESGLLFPHELIALPPGSTVDYPEVYLAKDAMHTLAAERFVQNERIGDYIEANAAFMKPYLCFVWLSHRYGNSAWYTWDNEHRSYSAALYDACKHEPEVQRAAALQQIFCQQMRRLKDYLESRGIRLFGDMPLYLSYDSAEVWANPQLFDLDAAGRRLSLAGVPPDAFAAGGQLWGNPIYNWDRMKDDGFQLFMRRIGHTLQFMDLLRLDHFIGYVNFWKVPCPQGEIPETAESGSWVKALPEAFFARLTEEYGTERFVAEDLGILNSDVCHVRDGLGFPGMIILQFCFEESVPDVQNFPADRLIYTGTHDNNTTRGWWDDLPLDSESRKNMSEYCRQHLGGIIPDGDNIAGIMLQIAQQSACQRMIFPMQDILGLGSAARMNIPGTALGNWQWRCRQGS